MSCAYCGTRTGPFHRDHVVPRSRGGPDEPLNIVFACVACNSSKRDLLPSEWRPHTPPFVAMIERRVSAVVSKKVRGTRRAQVSPVAPPPISCAACKRPLYPNWDAHVLWWEEPQEPFETVPQTLLGVEVLCAGDDACLARKKDFLRAKYGRAARVLDLPIDAFFGRWAWLHLEDFVISYACSAPVLGRLVRMMRQLSKMQPDEDPPTERAEGDDPSMVDD